MAGITDVPSTKEIVEEWILQYVWHEVLSEFKRDGMVQDSFNKKFLNGFIDHFDQGLDGRDGAQRLLICMLRIIVKLSDSTSVTIDHGESEETPLEEVLQQVTALKNITTDEARFNSLVLDTKCQAVLTCLKAKRKDLAEHVYRRLWEKHKPQNAEEKKAKEELKRLVRSTGSPRRRTSSQTHTELIKKLQKEFSELQQTLLPGIPILEAAALEEQIRLLAQPQADKISTSPQNNKKKKEKKKISTSTQAIVGRVPNLCVDEDFQELVQLSNLPHLKGQVFRLPPREKQKWLEKVKIIAQQKDQYLQEMPQFSILDSATELLGDDFVTVENNAEQINHVENVTSRPKTRSENRPDSPSKKASPRIKTNISSKEEDEMETQEIVEVKTSDCSSTSDQDPHQGRRAESSSPSPQKRSLQQSIRQFKFRRNINREDRHKTTSDPVETYDIVDSSDLDSSLEVPKTLRSLPPSARFRRSLAPKNTDVKESLRTPWREDEEEMLFRAVQDLGVGNWLAMKDRYNFPGRTNVNLKDKWRNMVKIGRDKEWAERLQISCDR